MEVIKIHRAFWDYRNNAGILKVHDPKVGVFGVMTNFSYFKSIGLDDIQIQYYRHQYRSNKLGILALGCYPERDVSYVLREETEFGFFYDDIHLKLFKNQDKFYLDEFYQQELITYQYQELANLVV